MRPLSPAGRRMIDDMAQRHGFSADAVLSMLDALLLGKGSMAQFDHPEFGGAGQWMQGGMTMVPDMLDNRLKSRIDDLCTELSGLLARQPGPTRGAGLQSQSQGGGEPAEAADLFAAPAAATTGEWWPAGLGQPASIGAQNGLRYAYFPPARRLAVEVGGRVTVYDTLDHRITGFSQQQGAGASLGFSSQHGLVDAAALPVVPLGGPAAPGTADLFASIEKLAELHAKGILNDEEFAAKKAELLGRL